MSDEEINAGNAGAGVAAEPILPEQPSPDEHTTEPNAPEPPLAPESAEAPSGKWQMPKPKFQQTSGYLPQGYVKQVEQEQELDTTLPADVPVVDPLPPTANGAVPPAAPAVEPQPDLAEIVPDEPSETMAAEPAVAAGRGTGVAAIVLGVIGIVIFVIVFLAAVYFFLLR